jgi:hypothetical protein
MWTVEQKVLELDPKCHVSYTVWSIDPEWAWGFLSHPAQDTVGFQSCLGPSFLVYSHDIASLACGGHRRLRGSFWEQWKGASSAKTCSCHRPEVTAQRMSLLSFTSPWSPNSADSPVLSCKALILMTQPRPLPHTCLSSSCIPYTLGTTIWQTPPPKAQTLSPLSLTNSCFFKAQRANTSHQVSCLHTGLASLSSGFHHPLNRTQDSYKNTVLLSTYHLHESPEWIRL